MAVALGLNITVEFNFWKLPLVHKINIDHKVSMPEGNLKEEHCKHNDSDDK